MIFKKAIPVYEFLSMERCKKRPIVLECANVCGSNHTRSEQAPLVFLTAALNNLITLLYQTTLALRDITVKLSSKHGWITLTPHLIHFSTKRLPTTTRQQEESLPGTLWMNAHTIMCY